MNLSQRVRVVTRGLARLARFAVLGEKARNGTPFVFPFWGSGSMGIESLIDYLTYADEGYGKNAIVHACIREISRSAPSARLQVRRKLKNGQAEVWEDHPLQKVLNRPNKHQSQRAFVELYYTYLNIDGNAFIIRERAGKRTTALWLPRPDRMRPIVAEHDLLGYVYVTENGQRIAFLPEEVIHIKEPNPSDEFEGLGRGLAPLAAAAVETDVDNRATAFMKKFFDNAAVPFGLLKSKNLLDDAEVSRIRARIKSQYSGEDNWHEMMILDADADYQRMGLDLAEMAFADLRAISETRICATFKVPPILIGVKAGLDASTYSNYSQARRAMWEDKIIPDNGKLADELTADFADELGEEGVIGHDYSDVVALQEDRSNRFNRANQGVNGGWITVNEARREVGLGPVDDGDIFLRRAVSGEGEKNNREGAKDAEKEKDILEGEKSGEGKKNNHRGTKDTEKESGSGKEGKSGEPEVVYKRRDQVARSWELRFLKAARGQFEEESREIEALLRAGKTRKAVQWDDVLEVLFGFINGKGTAGWAATFLPLLTGLMDDQGEEWADELGIDWNFQNPQVAAFLQRYALGFAEQIAETTRNALRLTLIQAREEGWLITQLIQETGRLYAGWRDFQRSEMIARSETIRASNAGAVEAYRLGGIKTKQWWAAEDERTCPFCGEMHGQMIAVEESWYREGDVMRVGEQTLKLDYGNVGYPPLHPDCRCTVLPVVEEEEV